MKDVKAGTLKFALGITTLLVATGCGGDGGSTGIRGPQTGVLFSSDWSSATGTSDDALRDTDKQIPWSERWGGNGSLTVVAASGRGFPSGMQNVLRVTQYQQDFDWVMANKLWDLPRVGGSLAFRIYLRNEINDDQGDFGTVYASHHPIESTGVDGSLTGGYYAWHFGSYNDGTFPLLFSMADPTFPFNGWTFGAPAFLHGGRDFDPAPFNKNTTYRLEWKFTRTGTNRYALDMRVYGPDDQTLLFDRSSIYAWTGLGQTLSTSGSGLQIDDSRMTGMRLGTNGGGWTFSSPQYVYWGGFAVCADDWCGPYTTP